MNYHQLKIDSKFSLQPFARRPQIRPNTGFFKQLIKYEERLFSEASVKMVYCEAIDKEIPDVYEPDYSGMTWFRQRYGPIEKSWKLENVKIYWSNGRSRWEVREIFFYRVDSDLNQFVTPILSFGHLFW